MCCTLGDSALHWKMTLSTELGALLSVFLLPIQTLLWQNAGKPMIGHPCFSAKKKKCKLGSIFVSISLKTIIYAILLSAMVSEIPPFVWGKISISDQNIEPLIQILLVLCLLLLLLLHSCYFSACLNSTTSECSQSKLRTTMNSNSCISMLKSPQKLV